MAKILLFEEPEVADALKAALAALGHEPVMAVDGYSVLPMAIEHKPDLVLLAYNPPAFDGKEILMRLRAVAACAATPIIFSSATPKFEIEFVIMDAPAIGYIDKPLDVKQLKEAIELLLGTSKPAAAAAPAISAAPAASAAPAPPASFNGEPDLDGVRDDVIKLD